MWRLLISVSSLVLAGLMAKLVGLSLGALLATLATGLLTALCFVPAVLLSEMLSRRADGSRSHENGPAL